MSYTNQREEDFLPIYLLQVGFDLGEEISLLKTTLDDNV